MVMYLFNYIFNQLFIDSLVDVSCAGEFKDYILTRGYMSSVYKNSISSCANLSLNGQNKTVSNFEGRLFTYLENSTIKDLVLLLPLLDSGAIFANQSYNVTFLNVRIIAANFINLNLTNGIFSTFSNNCSFRNIVSTFSVTIPESVVFGGIVGVSEDIVVENAAIRANFRLQSEKFGFVSSSASGGYFANIRVDFLLETDVQQLNGIVAELILENKSATFFSIQFQGEILKGEVQQLGFFFGKCAADLQTLATIGLGGFSVNDMGISLIQPGFCAHENGSVYDCLDEAFDDSECDDDLLVSAEWDPEWDVVGDQVELKLESAPPSFCSPQKYGVFCDDQISQNQVNISNTSEFELVIKKEELIYTNLNNFLRFGTNLHYKRFEGQINGNGYEIRNIHVLLKPFIKMMNNCVVKDIKFVQFFFNNYGFSDEITNCEFSNVIIQGSFKAEAFNPANFSLFGIVSFSSFKDCAISILANFSEGSNSMFFVFAEQSQEFKFSNLSLNVSIVGSSKSYVFGNVDCRLDSMNESGVVNDALIVNLISYYSFSNYSSVNLNMSHENCSKYQIVQMNFSNQNCYSGFQGQLCQNCASPNKEYFGLCAVKQNNESRKGEFYLEAFYNELIRDGICYLGYSGYYCDECDLGFQLCEEIYFDQQQLCENFSFGCYAKQPISNGDCYQNPIDLAMLLCLSCFDGYTGMSCESCASGYYRSPQQFCILIVIAGCITVKNGTLNGANTALCASPCKIGNDFFLLDEINQLGLCGIQDIHQKKLNNTCLNVENTTICINCSISYVLFNNSCREAVFPHRGRCFKENGTNENSTVICLECNQYYDSPQSGCNRCSTTAKTIGSGINIRCYQICSSCPGDCYFNLDATVTCLSCVKGYQTPSTQCKNCIDGYIPSNNRSCLPFCVDCIGGNCYCIDKLYPDQICNVAQNVECSPPFFQNFENQSHCFSNSSLVGDKCFLQQRCDEMENCLDSKCLFDYVLQEKYCVNCTGGFHGRQCDKCENQYIVMPKVSVNSSKTCILITNMTHYKENGSNDYKIVEGYQNITACSSSSLRFKKINDLYTENLKIDPICFTDVSEIFNIPFLQRAIWLIRSNNSIGFLYNRPQCISGSNCTVCHQGYYAQFCENQSLLNITDLGYINVSSKFPEKCPKSCFVSFEKVGFSRNAQVDVQFSMYDIENESVAILSQQFNLSFGNCISNFKDNYSINFTFDNWNNCKFCRDDYFLLDDKGFYGCYKMVADQPQYGQCFNISQSMVYCKSCENDRILGVQCDQCKVPFTNFEENSTKTCQYNIIFQSNGDCVSRDNIVYCRQTGLCLNGSLINNNFKCTKCKNGFVVDLDGICRNKLPVQLYSQPYSLNGQCYQTSAQFCTSCEKGWTGTLCDQCDLVDGFIKSIDGFVCKPYLKAITYGYCYEEQDNEGGIICTTCFVKGSYNPDTFQCNVQKIPFSYALVVGSFVAAFVLTCFLLLIIMKRKIIFIYLKTIYSKLKYVLLAQISALAFALEDQYLNQELGITMMSSLIISTIFVTWFIFFERYRDLEDQGFFFKKKSDFFYFLVSTLAGIVPDTLLSTLVVQQLMNSQSFLNCMALPITLLIYSRYSHFIGPGAKVLYNAQQIWCVILATAIPAIASIILISVEYINTSYEEQPEFYKIISSLPVILICIVLSALNIFLDAKIISGYDASKALQRFSFFQFFYSLAYFVVNPADIVLVFRNQSFELLISILMYSVQFISNTIVLKNLTILEFNMNMNASVTWSLLIQFIGTAAEMSRLKFVYEDYMTSILSVIPIVSIVILVMIFYINDDGLKESLKGAQKIVKRYNAVLSTKSKTTK